MLLNKPLFNDQFDDKQGPQKIISFPFLVQAFSCYVFTSDYSENFFFLCGS